MKIGSLFTGIGGIELGLQEAGVPFELAWWAEWDENLSEVRLPGTDYDANLGDVTTVDWSGDSLVGVEAVDLITAGFPCQPVSLAGGKRGADDPRWMWPATFKAIQTLRPHQVFLENVTNLAYFDNGRLFDEVTADLYDLGYGVRWITLGACHVGCAHHRHRLFLLATQGTRGCQKLITSSCGIRGRFQALPTPTANGYGFNQGGTSEEGPKRPSLAMVAQQEDWDLYMAGIFRQSDRYGDPLIVMEYSELGTPRLSVQFVEWLMCLPPGHVSGRLPRAKALQAIGNAVCPPQMAEAWKILTA